MSIQRSFLLVVLATSVAGCDQLFGHRTFDDCILQNMKGATSDIAARAIHKSCREKFPEGAEAVAKSDDLEPWQVAALTGRAGLNYGNSYSGSIYNGNQDITITQVRVEVTTKSDGKSIARTYTADVTIPPLSTRDFSFDVVTGDKGADYSWNISGAKGY